MRCTKASDARVLVRLRYSTVRYYIYGADCTVWVVLIEREPQNHSSQLAIVVKQHLRRSEPHI